MPRDSSVCPQIPFQFLASDWSIFVYVTKILASDWKSDNPKFPKVHWAVISNKGREDLKLPFLRINLRDLKSPTLEENDHC